MTPTPHFFGRESELGRLDHMLQNALAGQGQTAFVAGDAGSGKSALVEAFIERAQQSSSDALATMTTCDSQTGQSDAYLPFLETLSQLSGDTDRFRSRAIRETNADRLQSFVSVTTKAILEEAPNLIGNLIPGGSFIFYAARFSAEKAGWLNKFDKVHRQTKLEGKIEAERIFQLYTDLIIRLSRNVPLILVFDDLHWVDPSSTQLFFHLSRRIGGSPIMLIGAYRPVDMGLGRNGKRHPMLSVINELKRIHGDIFIELGNESQKERRSLVTALIDAEPNKLDDAFREAFFEHTSGHPLFSEELLKSFRERGEIVRDSDGDWVQSGEIDWQALPARVEGIIEERIDRLDEDLHEIVSVASVQGEKFLAQIVAPVLEVDDRKLLRRLSRDLENRHGLVKEDDTVKIGGQRVTRFHFAHNLFQQYLYNDLSEGERKNLHADVAELIEALYADRRDDMAIQLAYHFAEADDWQKAIPYYLTAANRALRVSSYDSALSFLERALEKTGELGAEEAANTELELLVAIGSVQQALKGFTDPEVEATFTKACELAMSSDDAMLRASAIYGLWTVNLFKLNLDEARTLAQEIEALGESSGDPIVKVIAYRALANGFYQEGRLEETIANADKVIENYDPDKVADYLVHLTYDPKVFALGLRSWAESIQGDFGKAQETKAKMYAWAAELNHPISTCVAHLCALKLEYNRKDTVAIDKHAAEMRELAGEYRFPWYLAFGEMFTSWQAAIDATKKDRTDEHAEGLERTYTEGVAPDRSLLIHSQFCRMITEVLLGFGRLDDALAWVNKGIEIAEAKKEHIYLGEMRRIKGLILQQQGNAAESIDEINKAIATTASNGQKLFELRARVSLCQALKCDSRSADEAIGQLRKLVGSFPAGTGNADLENAQYLL